jgi:hypothetical protein
METPLLREFTRYQMFWAAQFRKMIRIVLWADEKYGNGGKYETYDAKVSTDKLIENDFAKISQAISGMATAVLFPSIQAKLLPPETARLFGMEMWKNLLPAMGVKNVDELVNDDTFKVNEPIQVSKPVVPAAQPAGTGADQGQPGTEPPIPTAEGGQGSGNFGHAGIPGQLGGSAPGGGNGDGTLSGGKIAMDNTRWKSEDTITGKLVVEFPARDKPPSGDEIATFIKNNPPNLTAIRGPKDIEDVKAKITDSGKDWVEVEVDITPTADAGQRWTDQTGGEEEWSTYHESEKLKSMSSYKNIKAALSTISELREAVKSIKEQGDGDEDKAIKMTESQVIRRDPETGEIVGAKAIQYYEHDGKDGSKPRKTKVIETRTVRRDPATHKILGVDTVRKYEDVVEGSK